MLDRFSGSSGISLNVARRLDTNDPPTCHAAAFSRHPKVRRIARSREAATARHGLMSRMCERHPRWRAVAGRVALVRVLAGLTPAALGAPRR